MDPKEVRSSWGPRVMCIGQSASSRGRGMDLSAHKRVNPGGGGGPYLGTRVIFLVVWSPLAQVSVMEPSLQRWGPQGRSQSHLTSWGQTDHYSPPWEWGICRVLAPLYRAPLEVSQNGWHIFGAPWPMPISLWPALLDNLKFPWSLFGEGSPFVPAILGRVGWSMSHLFLVVQLATWR